MELDVLKSRIIAEIESKKAALFEISRRIHSHPEIGFKEVLASQWITEFLEKEGFRVERGIAGLPTSLRAGYGSGRPVIGFLAEYDALPEIGHACGHNLIAGAALGAVLGARLAVDACGGTVRIIGTPAEELYAGKELMLRQGAFDGLDAVMMVHFGSYDCAVIRALACQTLSIEFFGKAAHAAGEPQAGINALDAMLLSFNAINALRQHLPPAGMVHGIITDGGQAANIIPDHSAASFIVRAAELSTMETIKKKVINCFQAGAEATGARLEYRWDEHYYAPLKSNLAIGRLLMENMLTLGRPFVLQEPEGFFGSTDFGNVSQAVPGIHAWVKIADKGVAGHSVQLREAAGSDAGMQSMLQAAQAMAMTAADLLASPQALEMVRREFQESI